MTRLLPIRMPSICLAIALSCLLAACGKQEAAPAAAEAALPQSCVEAEAAQRACTEHMAGALERAGQAAGAKALRDAFAKEMAQTRERWRGVADKDGLAQSCAAMRSGLAAQPQCKD